MSGDLISKKSYDELMEQLNHLKNVKRKEISKAVGEAREHGDLRENSAYQSARQEQSLNEAKIRELEERLKSAEIMEEEERSKDFVSLGSKVKYKNVETGDVMEYTIVSDIEANVFQKKISASTPVGEAMLGAEKGATVEVLAPAGIIKYKILEIS